ncbi:MAG: KUP/HAK/KT family potassium transporter [Ignavibacteria bacterium]
MGLVFGDIGTSPIYTLTVIVTLTAPTYENMMGILSLIFWTLIILVTVEYAWLAISLSIKGEGGIIVLKEILSSTLKKGRRFVFIAFLGYLGISLLMGDGVITPAISILSAVEGLELIPGFGHISTNLVILITCIITIALFSIQFKGTGIVALSFGPIMLLWFAALFLSGLFFIIKIPGILSAVSPHYAINFIAGNGFTGFFILSEVILCATGGEALYADIGHLGSEPIRHAWIFVFFALIVNYFGQGAYVIMHQKTEFILFSMVKEISPLIYIPFLLLTIMATIIASQAMISAMMSLVYQGMTTKIFPLMRVKYTSSQLKSQIYIGFVNWTLMIAVLFMVLLFQKSENLAAAYGLAVTATMTISSIFMIWIFKHQRKFLKFSVTVLVLLVDIIFLIAVMDKFPHGGFWSVIIASLPLFVTLLWYFGNWKMSVSFRSLPIDTFLESYNQIYSSESKIKGTALFFVKSMEMVPPYVVHTMIRGNIIYEDNIFVSIQTTDAPYGISIKKIDHIAAGLRGYMVEAGYMEMLDLVKIFKESGISGKAIFYGEEDIVTKKPLLKIFSLIKRITPHFVKFHDLPYNKLHGVVTRLEL